MTTLTILGIELSQAMSVEESSSDANDAVGWYDDHVQSIVERYESLAPEKVNAWLAPLLPREIIIDWWTAGYVHNANPLIGKRFLTEACASLPGIVETPSPETVFDGMELQRLRLHHDQQLPEWE
jgi:hypothetical protein